MKVIMGIKGSGKTKEMIELVNKTAKESKGAVVCIEHGTKLQYDVSHAARLINTIPYDIRSYQVLRGFITGLYASNYDLHDILIDSLVKVSGEEEMDECERFLEWCDHFSKENNINFTITISIKTEDATEKMLQYC